ncbi:hypothetical protein ACFYPZ_14720 [Streptomyces sp. NPDC005506]|uniref:hypothetical protein n=1 Tax=unclassified Streptomyces TaxID=2593676 RepID=UPI0036A37601
MSSLEDAAAAHARQQRAEADAAAAARAAGQAAAEQELQQELQRLAVLGREFFALARRHDAVEFPLYFPTFAAVGYTRVPETCIIAAPWIKHAQTFARSANDLYSPWAVIEAGVFYGRAEIHRHRDFRSGSGFRRRDDVFVVGRLAGYGSVHLMKDEDLVAAASALLEPVPVPGHGWRQSSDLTGIQKNGLIGYVRQR